MKSRLIGLSLAAAVAVPAFAHHVGELVEAGDLLVGHAYTYENASMAHAVDVFLTIDNRGEQPDRLIGAEVDFAGVVEIQAQVLDGGTLKTTTIDAVEIAAGQTLTFQPGGVHLVLQGVQQTFEHGEHFEMSLTFEQSGTVEVEVEVEPAADQLHDDEPAA